MPSNTDIKMADWPQTVLMIGCGLIGTSFTLAVKAQAPKLLIDGVETNPSHREAARSKGVYREIYNDLSEAVEQAKHYDLSVLAVPVDIAMEFLPVVKNVADIIMDVCSVKQQICEAANTAQLTSRFAPTHPMAGRASGGPEAATRDLFEDAPWILFRHWPACDRVAHLLLSTGARICSLEDAQDHDVAMAAVSHGVHLASLATMLSYKDASFAQQADWAAITGPGFRDVTRLSASPPDFWVSTLLANRQAVSEQINRIRDRLKAFDDALLEQNDEALRALLTEAQGARVEWETHRERRTSQGG